MKLRAYLIKFERTTNYVYVYIYIYIYIYIHNLLLFAKDCVLARRGDNVVVLLYFEALL
jgi:hypothetical protein